MAPQVRMNIRFLHSSYAHVAFGVGVSAEGEQAPKTFSLITFLSILPLIPRIIRRITLAGKLLSFLGFPLLTLVLTGCPPNDTIHVSSGTTGQTGQQGVLVDGVKDGTFENDQPFSGPIGANFSVGNFMLSSGDKRGEIIAYSDGHPPTIFTPAPWTDQSDLISVPPDDEYSIPVYIWVVVVRGTYQSKLRDILNTGVRTEQIWTDEKQGIRFSQLSANIIDATGTKDANGRKVSNRYRYNKTNDFFAFDCSTLSGGVDDRNVIMDVGYKENAINVYYLDHVVGLDGEGPNYGVSCRENVTLNGKKITASVIAMGSDTGEDLLSHELGHQFSLGHVDHISDTDPCPADPHKPPLFCDTNVMHSSSPDRNYLTEGQTFRAIALDSSAINAVYQLRPDRLTRSTTSASCPFHTLETKPDCPAIQKRIWKDGPLNP